MRPQSIIRFERLYLSAFVIGLLSTFQNWEVRQRMMEQGAGGTNLAWLGPAASAIGVVIALSLWYFVARRASVIAKWIVVVLAAWGAVLLAILAFGLIAGRGAPTLLLVGAAQNVLYIVAAAMLFGPDARAWFGEPSSEPAA